MFSSPPPLPQPSRGRSHKPSHCSLCIGEFHLGVGGVSSVGPALSLISMMVDEARDEARGWHVSSRQTNDDTSLRRSWLCAFGLQASDRKLPERHQSAFSRQGRYVGRSVKVYAMATEEDEREPTIDELLSNFQPPPTRVTAKGRIVSSASLPLKPSRHRPTSPL